MNILGIESSGGVASVAIVTDGKLLGEYTTNFKKTHSQTLLPMIDALVSLLEFDKKSLDAIAISSGPGSFTGLRIGSATAKGLALALDIPMVEVPTLTGLAFNLYGYDGLLCPIMDARRNQVYTGVYSYDNGQPVDNIIAQTAMGIDELIDKLNEVGEKVCFLGDGVAVFADYIMEHATFEYDFAPESHREQRASSIATLGARYFEAGKAISAADHAPDYLRLSQAERERLEKDK